jgi:hypothetical protein
MSVSPWANHALELLRLPAYYFRSCVSTSPSVEVSYAPKLAVSYSLANSGVLPPATFAVLERHFQALDLGRRYAKQASTTVALLLRRFRTPLSLGLGPRRLLRRLQQMAADRAMQCPPNHWEVALLQRLAASSDFTTYVFS